MEGTNPRQSYGASPTMSSVMMAMTLQNQVCYLNPYDNDDPSRLTI